MFVKASASKNEVSDYVAYFCMIHKAGTGRVSGRRLRPIQSSEVLSSRPSYEAGHQSRSDRRNIHVAKSNVKKEGAPTKVRPTESSTEKFQVISKLNDKRGQYGTQAKTRTCMVGSQELYNSILGTMHYCRIVIDNCKLLDTHAMRNKSLQTCSNTDTCQTRLSVYVWH